jgi:murein DD-endopeptidase MepM/ murein hydrolase activator NlpD
VADKKKDASVVDRYVLDYPVTKQFCLPLRSYADDVTQTTQRVGNLMFRVKANGGYGLPVVDKIGDKHLLHLGADVGWQQIGAPVYAIADGIVRISEGPAPERTKKASAQEVDSAKPKSEARDEPRGNNLTLAWGNLIVVEHRIAETVFATSIYGHLASERFVKAGEMVKARQVIGTIGKMGIENGGYRPHLHLGLREGRMFQPGSVLCELVIDGKPVSIKIVALHEDEIELKSDVEIPPNQTIFQNGKKVATIVDRDGKKWLPTSTLKEFRQHDFAIVGYGLTTRGWLDPTAFLKKALSDAKQIPFGEMPEPRDAKRPR